MASARSLRATWRQLERGSDARAPSADHDGRGEFLERFGASRPPEVAARDVASLELFPGAELSGAKQGDEVVELAEVVLERSGGEDEDVVALGRSSAQRRRASRSAAKILNVYLKTRCYIAAQGRDNLSDAIHPPIDAGLWLGLQRRFASRPDILERSNCVRRIKDIVDYACYVRIVDGCRAAAEELGCKLIEAEQLWAGTEFEIAAV